MNPVGEPAGGVAVVAVVEPERSAKAAQMSETRDAAVVKLSAGEMTAKPPTETPSTDLSTDVPAANSSSDMTAANSSADGSASNSTAEVSTAHPAAEMSAAHPAADMSAAHSPTKMPAAHSSAVAAASSAAGDRIGRDRSASQHDGHHDERYPVQREFFHGRCLSVRDDAASVACGDLTRGRRHHQPHLFLSLAPACSIL
jgi:hypothetical protein